MLTCDICDREIKKADQKFILPREYRPTGQTEDICKTCNRKLDSAINDIKTASMVSSRTQIKEVVEKLKTERKTVGL